MYDCFIVYRLYRGIKMAVQPARRKQADRSELMRRKLIDAAIEALVEVGYSKTTAVEVCRRAGVTRGALFHHFDSLAALLAETMSNIYDRNFLSQSEAGGTKSLDQWVDGVWAKLQKPEFKAVIEIWFAARNEPEMADILRPSILKYAEIFSVSQNAASERRVQKSKQMQSFYRLARETMLGLALGRATTPGGAALPHEASVIEMLKSLAMKSFP
nr:hypothetical protein DBT45_10395 [Aerococcus tenax]